MKKLFNIFLIVSSLLLTSCEPEIEQVTPLSGEADFSVMVSLGNSLTAGYADRELFRSGQQNAYPALMARQMEPAGLLEFNLPLMFDEVGFGGRLVLGLSPDCQGDTTLGPVSAGGEPFVGNFAPLNKDVVYHNLGVPGAKVSHLLVPGYGMANPYYMRFARELESSSILNDALSLDPTFFTLWIGNNDILGYAISGGAEEPMTPLQDFQDNLQIIISQLTANGAKGAIANIPSVSDAAFFNTIPYNGLVLQSQEQADQLNAAYAQLPHINFQPGQNGFVVADSSAAGNMRQLQAGELILLSIPQDNLKCQYWGSAVPIPEQFYLSSDQVTAIGTAIGQYNEIISNYALEYGLALVDVNQLMQEIETGIYYDGLRFTTEFVTGGIFSLDGLHLTKRGQALVANAFIEAINHTYNSSVPLLPVSQFEGIVFP